MLDCEEKLVYTNGQGETGTPSLQPVIVRYADFDDLPTVYELYMAALEEIKDYVLEPDEDKCLDEVLLSWAKAPCILLEKAGEIVGFAGLKTIIAPYTSKPQLSEYMFYIKPNHRSVKLAKKLSDAVQEVARKHKMPLFMAHMVFDHTAKDKDKFLRRWGYTPYALSVAYRGDQ